MKMTKLECVTREDYVAHVAKRIKAAHTVTSTGNKRGGQRATARMYGLYAQQLSGVLSGVVNPPPKMLERDGLEAVTVYVRKPGRVS